MKRIEPLVAHVGKLIYFAALPNTDVKKCQLCLKSLEFLLQLFNGNSFFNAFLISCLAFF